MSNQVTHRPGTRLVSDYGMLLVLLLLCAFLSVITWSEQHPTGAAAGSELAGEILRRFGRDTRVLVAAREIPEDVAFAAALRDRLAAAESNAVEVVNGQPGDARAAIESAIAAGRAFDVIAVNDVSAGWTLFENLAVKFPALAKTQIVQPPSYGWPNFLKADNLLNIANQISVIAILAVGMTLVIVTGGIDLSVGSLVALSAVVATRLIRDSAGAEHAGPLAMVACCVAAIAISAALGAFSGGMVAWLGIPAFIVTLAMMRVAKGLAFILTEGQSVYQVPDTFVWLGRGADFFGVPNAVLLMLVLYAAAHVLMTRLPLGRHIYAVGGNREAARLSGIPVGRVLVFAYTASGALAGLGGIVLASQLKSGSPTYGLMYELDTIAAVVVGGASLSGGQGKIFGTLIGAFIIAVIQNGMNLTGVGSYAQNVILGSVIFVAVLLDQLKRRGWKRGPR